MHSITKFQINQLRQKSVLMTIESIAVFVASLFVSALLPTLLFRYMYADQQLTEQPKLLEYIPLIAFAVGVGYFLITVVTNITRELQIAKLTKELATMGDCECGECEMCSPTGMSNAVSDKKVGRPRRMAQK